MVKRVLVFLMILFYTHRFANLCNDEQVNVLGSGGPKIDNKLILVVI
jgi:hypothetical protein